MTKKYYIITESGINDLCLPKEGRKRVIVDGQNN